MVSWRSIFTSQRQYSAVWRITNKVGSDKCQTNHKVGRPFTEIVRPFTEIVRPFTEIVRPFTEIVRPFLDECLRLNNYFILSQNTFI